MKQLKSKMVMTASSMTCFGTCARRYYLAYGLGWKRSLPDMALRFGTAFHAGLECWFRNHDVEAAFAAAIGTAGGEELDATTCATIGALLRGYHAKWHDADLQILPEQEFYFAAPFKRGLAFAGKIDGVGTFDGGKPCIIEHKTTAQDISADSDYWATINRDQVTLYKAATMCDRLLKSRQAVLGETLTVIYDVIRKPTIRQKQTETAEAFGERLADDCINVRPDYYFARREVPVLACDLERFALRAAGEYAQIKAAKRAEKMLVAGGGVAADAWIKTGSHMVCASCPYRGGICDLTAIPDGGDWVDGVRFAELERVHRECVPSGV